MNKCNKCSKAFKQGVRKVGCEYCGKWFHAETCANISEDLYRMMEKEEQIHWFCKECNKKAPDVLLIVNKCVQENAELKKEMLEMRKVLKNIKEGKDEELIEIMKKIAREVYQAEKENEEKAVETTQPNKETIREIARNEVHENNDKKGRESNIVVSGIDEDKDAEEEISEILSYLDVTVEVRGIRRLGKERREGKNRAVWVNLANKKERNSVLEKAKGLKDEIQWKEVYINRDMTENERKEAFDLRVELRERRRQEGVARGRSKFIIHKGRVVNIEDKDRESSTEEDGISRNTEAQNTDGE